MFLVGFEMKELSFFIKIIVYLVAFAIVATLFRGVHIQGFFTLIAVGVLFALLNAFIKPLLVLLTLPLTAVTFGLFYFFINGFMVWLTSALLPGFVIDSFATAFWAAIFLSFISWIIEMIFLQHYE